VDLEGGGGGRRHGRELGLGERKEEEERKGPGGPLYPE
jgi:hypothetical protein